MLNKLLFIIRLILTIIHKNTITHINFYLNKNKTFRKLEIGPANKVLPGFESLNVVWSPSVSYVMDAGKEDSRLNNKFDLIVASHIIEHIPWYQVQGAINLWCSYLKKNGKLHIWTVDTLKISESLSAYFSEKNDIKHMTDDNWYRLNKNKDFWTWINARVFSYGDETGKINHPNWHRSLHSFKSISLLVDKNLFRTRELKASDRIGQGHGSIEFGIEIVKL